MDYHKYHIPKVSFVWFISLINWFNMPFEICFSIKSFMTKFTFVRYIAFMDRFFVLLERRFLLKAISTNGVSAQFISIMDMFDTLFHRRHWLKWIIKHITFQRFLSYGLFPSWTDSICILKFLSPSNPLWQSSHLLGTLLLWTDSLCCWREDSC